MRKRLLVSFFALAGTQAQNYTRGVGVYPGDPRQDFSPASAIDATTYRNLALRRPAYQSSAYDYNLTAQLVTDGIRANHAPRWIGVRTSKDGVLPKNQRELLFDDNWVTTIDLDGPRVWVELEWGGAAPPMIDLALVEGTINGLEPDNQEWACVLSVSNDGKQWQEVGRASGMAHPSGEWKAPISWTKPTNSRFYRFTFETGRPVHWHIGEARFYHGPERVRPGGPYDFTSAWRSAGAGTEWVAVDLGAICTFDRVKLAWLNRAEAGEIQVSDDGTTWSTLQALGANDDIKLQSPARGRWVRLRLTKSHGGEPYELSEFEVFGRGGPVPVANAAPVADANGRVHLAAGRWRIERASELRAAGPALSTPGFADVSWLPATVPGTALVSWWNAGALPDPNFGDNQLAISDSFFHSDFWYRNEFTLAPKPGRRMLLDFDGINWKAEVFFNGQRLGRIEGGFERARFDVTALAHAGANAVAVRVGKLATPGNIKEKTLASPGKNGGAPGADNPTYHASIGWDWIPTIRGRDTGIWADVWLTETGSAAVEDASSDTTALAADASSADVSISATIVNRTAAPLTGVLRGHFGETAFEQPVTLNAHERRPVKVNLHLTRPKLWWPNGYGEPDLYPVDLRFESGGAVSDSAKFQAGVRMFTYSEENHTLRMWINGRRFVARGGSWGFPESMLLYRAREYDAAVRYHREQNFTMIRNWVGQTGDEAFYDACDKYGIVVWQDFWLANPWDGPDPDNTAMFLNNARDYMLKVRKHPSIGIYVGRNEGYPPDAIERGLRTLVAELAPASHYIPSSADDTVSGHGPYQAMTPRYYFSQRATPKMHSELGMPDIPTMDSVRAMMAEKDLWPQTDVWGLHDFTLTGAQGGTSFRNRIDTAYGGAKDATEWVELAQFVNYDGYRAMFEAQSKLRMGMLLWMSHPAWPSFVWQTYDYFLEPNAAYFGSKKGSEPLHVQWNPLDDTVEVANYSGGLANGLSVSAEILNLDGSVKWRETAAVDSKEDSMVAPIHLKYPADLSAVHFIRLKLERGGALVSENFYLRGTEEGKFTAIRTLPKVKIDASTVTEARAGRWRLTTTLRNISAQPALMVRVKVVREKTGDRILPAIYSDNYIALMPGEARTISSEVVDADTRGEKPVVLVEGFNTRN